MNLGELAFMTKNFTGAEIEGLVKSALSFAFSRINTTAPGAKVDLSKNIKVERSDFLASLK